MCEKCEEMVEAINSGEQGRIHTAMLDWVVAKAGDDFAMILAHTDSMRDKMDDFDQEADSVLKHGSMAASILLNIITDGHPLAVAASRELQGISVAMMDFIWSAFWYGVDTGKRDSVARKVLMGQVKDEDSL